jgi:hypothetical protein
MAEAVPAGKVIRTIAAFDMDETITCLVPLSPILGIREAQNVSMMRDQFKKMLPNSYTDAELEEIGTFLWENYREIFNEGALRVMKLIKENRDKFDHVCIFSNNTSNTMVNLIRVIINKFIGEGTQIIDASYHINSKYHSYRGMTKVRTSQTKTKEDLFNLIKKVYLGLEDDNLPRMSDSDDDAHKGSVDLNAKILFYDDDSSHFIMRQKNVTSHHVNPKYNFYKDTRPFVEFFLRYEGLPENLADWLMSAMNSINRTNIAESAHGYAAITSEAYYERMVKTTQDFIDSLGGSSGGGKRKSRRMRRKFTRKGSKKSRRHIKRH